MSNIREIASLANVSIATVSRVLNNDSTYKMKSATKDKVWKAVAQTGYKHTSKKSTSAYKKLESNIKIGCVLSVTKEKYKDPYFMSILSGIEKQCEEKGFSIAFLRTYYELADRNVLYDTFKESISGIILMETLEKDLYSYIRARVPVCVGVDTEHTDIDNIAYDHFGAAAKATEYLIDQGHSQIAFIGGSGPSGNILYSQRYCGYNISMRRAGLAIHDSFVCNCQWSEDICIQQVKELMSKPTRPTAIFCASDLMAIAALSGLYSMHISVPNEVAVVGLSNIELSQFSSPPLTTLSIPTEQMGIAAVDALERRLLGSTLMPQKTFFPAQLVKRVSG